MKPDSSLRAATAHAPPGARRGLRPAPWLDKATLLVVLAVAFGLRVYRLGYQELRGDEAFGYFFSLRTVPGIVRATLTLKEPHPVGSYLLEKFWAGGAGSSEFALRFLSAWFGVAAVALLYRLARRLRLPRRPAILAAGLLAVSPYAIWHSQDARMYSISLALTLASTCLALEALARPRLSRWLAYAGVSWLALNTHYFVGFVLVAQNLWFLGLASLRRGVFRRLVPTWLASQLLVALLYLPWLLAAGGIIGSYAGNGDSPGFFEMLRRAFGVFAVGESLPDGQRLLAALLAATLLAWGTFRLAAAGEQGRRTLALLLLYLFLPVLSTWLGSQSRPIFNERYLIAAAPPFYLLLAATFFKLSARPRQGDPSPTARASDPKHALLRPLAGLVPVLLLVSLCAGAGLSLFHLYADPAFSKTRGWRELAAALRGAAAGLPSGEVRVVENYPDPTLWYYYPEDTLRLTLPPGPNDAAGAERLVSELMDVGVRRVILPLQPTSSWDPNALAPQVLQANYRLAATVQAAGWPVQVYARPPETLPEQIETFAGGLRLAGAAVEPEAIAPDGVLAVYLRWENPAAALAALPVDEKLTLQVLDIDGGVVAQTDGPFGPGEAGAAILVYGIVLPHDLPAGPFRLILALYDPDQAGARLLTAGGADAVELGRLAAQPQAWDLPRVTSR